MNSERIREIQKLTGQENSVSITQALMQVWNECAQEARAEIDKLYAMRRRDAINGQCTLDDLNQQLNDKDKLIEQLVDAVRSSLKYAEAHAARTKDKHVVSDAEQIKAALSAAERVENEQDTES